MEICEAVLKGKLKKEIFFSSYLCHPSMANNELSGPVLLNAIMLYIKKIFKKPLYSYRFVLLPETIGSIAYINKRFKTLKKIQFVVLILRVLVMKENTVMLRVEKVIA